MGSCRWRWKSSKNNWTDKLTHICTKTEFNFIASVYRHIQYMEYFKNPPSPQHPEFQTEDHIIMSWQIFMHSYEIFREYFCSIVSAGHIRCPKYHTYILVDVYQLIHQLLHLIYNLFHKLLSLMPRSYSTLGHCGKPRLFLITPSYFSTNLFYSTIR